MFLTIDNTPFRVLSKKFRYQPLPNIHVVAAIGRFVMDDAALVLLCFQLSISDVTKFTLEESRRRMKLSQCNDFRIQMKTSIV